MPANAMLMYPCNSTSLILGRKLLRFEMNVHLFCPSEVHKTGAGSIAADLKIAALGLGVKVAMHEDVKFMENMDYLVFPLLDVLPDLPRSEFALMVQTLFK